VKVHFKKAAALAHGVVKERDVPAAEIDRAIRRKESFLADPAVHTYAED
jgi:hypothetical protein